MSDTDLNAAVCTPPHFLSQSLRCLIKVQGGGIKIRSPNHVSGVPDERARADAEVRVTGNTLLRSTLFIVYLN